MDGSDDYEMVRVGIVLFGMYPSAEVKKENLPDFYHELDRRLKEKEEAYLWRN